MDSIQQQIKYREQGVENVQQSSEVFEYMKRFLTRMDLIEVNGVWCNFQFDFVYEGICHYLAKDR